MARYMLRFTLAALLVIITNGITKQECGVPDVPPDQSEDFIVGGQTAKRYSWPWQVAINIYYNSNRRFCGGSIISEHWILTAGHCCFGTLENNATMTVIVGKYNLSAVESTQQTYNVSKMILHENYTDGTNHTPPHYDVCLLLLSDNIQFSTSAKPVCLPDQDAGPGNFYTTGWGKRNDDEPPAGQDVLYQVILPLVGQEKCNKTFYNLTNDDVTSNMICAGYDNVLHDVCHGDSGGPLVRKVDGQWKVHGVTSWGMPRCGLVPPFGPGVFARVYYFLDWIEEHSGVTPPSY